MQGKKYNWLYGVLASLLTLAILFGGQILFNKYAMARPMDKMLEQLDGIESFKVHFHESPQNGELGKIQIKLNGVKNLQTLYGQLVAGLDKYGGAQKYDIILSDNRDKQLEEFYYHIHYLLEEARDKSNFVAMNEQIQKKGGASGVDSKIYVDANYIYLQLKKTSGESGEKEVNPHKPQINRTNSEDPRADSQMYVVLPRKRVL